MTQPFGHYNIYYLKTMKKAFLLLLITLLFGCIKDDDDGTNDSLPEITQEGKNTFGCTINGEIFIPKKEQGSIFDSSEVLEAKYYYEHYYTAEGYTLNISSYNDFTRKGIYIFLSQGAEQLQENMTYDFQEYSPNNINGRFTWINDPNTQNYQGEYYTQANSGELNIIKLDTVNKIISGTFWFDAIDYYGNPAEIRDGRFDLIYEEQY